MGWKAALSFAVLVACKGKEPPPAPREVPQKSPATSPKAIDAAESQPIVESSETCGMKDVELVYVVDDQGNLSSFDPRKLPDDPFHVVGTLGCAQMAQPFSMAVDNRGVAWVLHNDGNVFRTSIIDARCARTPGRPKGNEQPLFGMGFVKTGDSETLFVAANDPSRELATLDTKTMQYTPVAEIAANQIKNPELTGTADGKLFGYFPEKPNGFVAEIDPKTGKLVGPKRMLTAKLGEVKAYAFAFWGGTFYVFATSEDDNTAVHAIDRKTGKYKLVRDGLPHQIVGAGVSTCAPLLERAP